MCFKLLLDMCAGFSSYHDHSVDNNRKNVSKVFLFHSFAWNHDLAIVFWSWRSCHASLLLVTQLSYTILHHPSPSKLILMMLQHQNDYIYEDSWNRCCWFMQEVCSKWLGFWLRRLKASRLADACLSGNGVGKASSLSTIIWWSMFFDLLWLFYLLKGS